MSLIDELTKIVGEEWVTDRPEELFIYSRDMTENEPHKPDIVIMPKNTQEVQKIVILANEKKIPVTPYVAGANVGGIAIPVKGGIVIDLKRMDGVIQVDETNMYAILEPGVTFGHLKKLLDEKYPTLRYSYPMAPPFVSVACNALLSGLGNLSYMYGSMSDMICGLEVVLPTGEIAKIGVCAISSYWLGKHPLPDLMGLFINWQGTTGIVTKIGINLWPKPPVVKNALILTLGGPEAIYNSLIFKLAHSKLCDEIAGGLFHYKMSRGIMPVDEMKTMINAIVPVDDLENRAFFLTQLTMSGLNDKHFKIKFKLLNKMVNETAKKEGTQLFLFKTEDLADIGKKVDDFMNLPTQIPPLYDLREGGGLSWVGSYVPLTRWLEGCNKGIKVMDKYGFLPGVLHRPMKTGHYGVLRFYIPFNKSDPDELKTVRKMCSELVDVVLGIGGIPYKVPAWAAKKVFDNADPNFVELMKKVKKLLDPNGIMNPGRLIF
ncbi:MAG: FAD-binding oxidoreductase [Candidatus Helarchaeota archaeon]